MVANASKPQVKEVPIWRVRLVSILTHKAIDPMIKADIKAALDEIDHLRHALSMLGD